MLALPLWLLAVLAAGTAWHRLGERGLVELSPGDWIAVLFGVAVVAYAALIEATRPDDHRPPPVGGLPYPAATAALTVVMVAGAVTLYRPMLGIGLLADDFALLELARTLDLAPERWGYLRPVGLLTWWAVAGLGADADAAYRLHLLNVVLHGVNAALVGALAAGLGRSMAASALASALFLVSPIAVEPVVWCSAIFDVQATTLALMLCIVVVRRRVLRARDYALCICLAILMIGTKETGVVAGPLALLAHWTRWGWRSRAGYAVAAVLGGVAVVYALMRHLTGRLDPRLTPSLTVDSVDRLLTQAFGALFVPFHDALLNAAPAVAVLVPVAFLLLVIAWARRWHAASGDARLALFAIGGVVLAVAPTITPFGVLGDLQGSRYMYLPSALWVIAVAAALLDDGAPRRLRPVYYGAAAAILVMAVAAVRFHFTPWHEAADVRDGALLKLGALPASCVRVHASGAPDHVNGAYVFRNGLTEGAASIGRSYEFVREAQADDGCRVDLSDPRAAPTL